jgi:ABC-type polysaccharide transport system permease subunit
MKLGLIDAPILFLQSDNHTWLSMWLWGTWKSLGWSAIMYIAAIAGIDQELYEAGRVDGAKRFQLMRHITIPSLLPTYFVLLMLSVANFLNNGMDQYFVFQNAFNSQHIQVLDLFVYNLGLASGGYSLATAISILKSLVSITLLFAVNRLSKLLRGESMI